MKKKFHLNENNIVLNNVECNKKNNKQDIILAIEEHVKNKCFNIVETINANNVNLIDLGINLKCECNKIFDSQIIDSIDMIIIENQISPIANRMKTIQGMIAQYFINKGTHICGLRKSYKSWIKIHPNFMIFLNSRLLNL